MSPARPAQNIIAPYSQNENLGFSSLSPSFIFPYFENAKKKEKMKTNKLTERYKIDILSLKNGFIAEKKLFVSFGYVKKKKHSVIIIANGNIIIDS